jgi:hypothetical protein
VNRLQEFNPLGQECVNPVICEQTCRYDQEIELLPSTYASTNGITTVRYRVTVSDPNGPPVMLSAWASDICIGPD